MGWLLNITCDIFEVILGLSKTKWSNCICIASVYMLHNIEFWIVN